jgi:hypothetical protein
MLELPAVQDRPQLFSTFLMWLLADLFHDLPEVGDIDKPKLVFFFDEAHLLFADASKDFLQAIEQTVRLIRSKGVGVFFVTQSPRTSRRDVLAQLGNRVQHALRAFTPDDAKALKAAVSTYPKSAYDLQSCSPSSAPARPSSPCCPSGAPRPPVAWTRMRAPSRSWHRVAVSPLAAKYSTYLERESASEMLGKAEIARTEAEKLAAQEAENAKVRAAAAAAAEKERLAAEKVAAREAAKEAAARRRPAPPRSAARLLSRAWSTRS